MQNCHMHVTCGLGQFHGQSKGKLAKSETSTHLWKVGRIDHLSQCLPRRTENFMGKLSQKCNKLVNFQRISVINQRREALFLDTDLMVHGPILKSSLLLMKSLFLMSLFRMILKQFRLKIRNASNFPVSLPLLLFLVYQSSVRL